MASKRLAAPAAATSAGKQLASWRDRAAKSVEAGKQQLAKIPAQSGNFISFQGGTITLAGNPLANPLPVIVLAYASERAYYSKPYQPGVLAVPDCYSYDGIGPHEKAKVPQSDRCNGCRFNEFGSAQNGNGKGCKEGARLVLLHADAMKSTESVETATLVQAKLSVLNAKVFRSFAEAVEAENAVWASGITLLSARPDSKSQYAVSFQLDAVVFGDDIMNAVSARVDEAEKLLTQPYPDIEDAAPPARRGAPTPAAPARKRKFQ